MQNKIYMFLGLARKANAVIIGEESCLKAIRKKKVSFILIAQDTSDNTKDKIISSCNYHKVDYRMFGEKELIGKFIGKNITAIIGINNNGFVKKLVEMIDNARKE